MFPAWCDTRIRSVLIGPTQIQGLSNTEQGMVLSYLCDCGAHGQMLTGSATGESISGHIAAISSASESPSAA